MGFGHETFFYCLEESSSGGSAYWGGICRPFFELPILLSEPATCFKLFWSEIVAGIVGELETLQSHDERLVVCAWIEPDELVLLDEGNGMSGYFFSNGVLKHV